MKTYSLLSFSAVLVSLAACNPLDPGRGIVIDPPGIGAPCAATCSQGVSISARVPLDEASLRRSTIRVCKNDSCGEGTPAPGAFGDVCAISIRGASKVGCHLWEVGDGKGFSLSIRIEGDNAEFVDGDRYRLLVTDGEGRRLVDVERLAAYRDERSPCDDRVCRQADITAEGVESGAVRRAPE
jgi:hypothetical protein